MNTPMNESDLNRMLRKLRHQPHGGVGSDFAEGVIFRLADRKPTCPPGILAGIASVMIALSASLGYSLAQTHAHRGDQPTPPPLAAFGAGDFFSPR